MARTLPCSLACTILDALPDAIWSLDPRPGELDELLNQLVPAASRKADLADGTEQLSLSLNTSFTANLYSFVLEAKMPDQPVDPELNKFAFRVPRKAGHAERVRVFFGAPLEHER